MTLETRLIYELAICVLEEMPEIDTETNIRRLASAIQEAIEETVKRLKERSRHDAR